MPETWAQKEDRCVLWGAPIRHLTGVITEHDWSSPLIGFAGQPVLICLKCGAIRVTPEVLQALKAERSKAGDDSVA